MSELSARASDCCARSARRVPSKTIGGGHRSPAPLRGCRPGPARASRPRARRPGKVVALDQAVGVVVDRLAGPRQQPGGRVVLAEDQVRVGLAALQRDAHGHLAERAAGQRVRAAEGLRAEETWMPNARPCRTRRSSSSAASCASLSSSTKNSWNSSTISRMRGIGVVRPGLAVAVQVLHAGVAEHVAAVASARRRAAAARSGRTRARSRSRRRAACGSSMRRRRS